MWLWLCGFFQEEEKINRISVESRVRKDRESLWADKLLKLTEMFLTEALSLMLFIIL